ncbi:hypothetical protein CHRY9390_00402 [Chryseobacterium aquaeductus]|uniref:Uncharacterized protein n=1 Tax=Chryseobacterium aquaeductus TaxID=2675056 RepID=A0A9N8QR93_9FLAO|nr:hypothetical protein [Chryseobacterium aquaeductus]CAA7329759.1 hypothetical protein CHRY9390_00402 [Chryseobacterium potabilaquae]CAD7798883.1 hypothetical protein CHRY9390_00402 [Chryseobacterium aquaeductus]
MECNETNIGLLFTQQPPSKWLEIFALLFLLVLIPIVKSGIESFKEYEGKTKIAVVLFYSGFAGVFLLFASLCYPINQYEKQYSVALYYKTNNKELIVTSGKNKQEYKNSLSDFKAFEFTENSKTNDSKTKSYNYDLNIIRKDGLMIWLGNFSEKNWKSVQKLIEKVNLPLQQNLPILYQKSVATNKINYNKIKLKEDITSAICNENEDISSLEWELKVNPLMAKIGFGLLIIGWLFTVFQTLANNLNRNSFIFMYSVLLILTTGFGYYFLNTFGAKQHLFLTKSGYTSYTKSLFFGKTQANKGNWKDLKIVMINIGPDQNGGIVISETENYTNDLISILEKSFKNAVDGKYKYIRTENLSIHDQLLLADYFLEKKQQQKLINW